MARGRADPKTLEDKEDFGPLFFFKLLIMIKKDLRYV